MSLQSHKVEDLGDLRGSDEVDITYPNLGLATIRSPNAGQDSSLGRTSLRSRVAYSHRGQRVALISLIFLLGYFIR